MNQMILIKQIKKFVRISSDEKELYLKGWLLALMLYTMVNFLPAKWYINLLRSKPVLSSKPCNRTKNIHLVRKTVRRIDRSFPFTLTCLIKSATFKLLLNTLGIESKIAIGINNPGTFQFKAHAYLTSDDQIIFLKSKAFIQLTTLDYVN